MWSNPNPASSSHATATTIAPWKPLFASHLSKLGPSPELCLATVTHTGQPRARYCIHRGFFATLPENSHNKTPKNPAVYESDCPTFTVDARMAKVFDIFATGKGKGTVEQSRSGSGGGGPVEAVYWVKETMTQWRVRGRCWLIAADDVEGGTESGQNSGTVSMKAEVGRYLRKTGAEGEDDWSWKREVEATFGNLSPIMKGSFKNPPPGTPVNNPNSADQGQKLGQQAGELEDEDLARKNFRVAVITPEEVEQVDLSTPGSNKRCLWRLSEEAGGPADDGTQTRAIAEWNMVELWP